VPLLQLITLSGAAQMVTSSGTKGNIITSQLAGAVAAMGGKQDPSPRSVAGAHLNPAFSFAMCLLERFPWWKFPIFVAMLADGLCLCSADAIWYYSNGTLTVSGPLETASIFATYPADYLSIANGFLDPGGAGTAVLLVGVLAILDTRNKGIPKGLEPVAGSPINPARDFGPRLFTYVAGWGSEVFSRGNGWWWVPVVAPLLGAAVGSALYQL
ncbi:Aquaporin-10, partial [Tauraco erythrolophus]